jgi:hypothetical protein
LVAKFVNYFTNFKLQGSIFLKMFFGKQEKATPGGVAFSSSGKTGRFSGEVYWAVTL